MTDSGAPPRHKLVLAKSAESVKPGQLLALDRRGRVANTLVRLARVLADRGDEDLALHCLTEAGTRSSWCELEKIWPALHQWALERHDYRQASVPESPVS